VNPCPPNLKLFSEQQPAAKQPTVEEIPQLEDLRRAFEQATGWRLKLTLNSGTSGQRVCSEIELDESLGVRSTPRLAAGKLASSIAQVMSHLQATREQLWRAEAELAACVPVGVRNSSDQHLAERLEAVLRGAAEAVGSKAAALYLLDDSSTHVKLRSCWGMSRAKLNDPPRSLDGSLAELEALLGSAVVIADQAALPDWPVPEDFPAGVCIPVASETTLLGVMWVFNDTPREYSDRETGVLEIAAGRIASDLERTSLLREAVDSRHVSMALQRAAAWTRNRIPNIPPLLDAWQVAGYSSIGDGLSGDWYDWSILADGRLAVALCDADGDQIEAALNATAMHSAYRAHAAQRHSPAILLKHLNETLWTSSAGGDGGSMVYTTIEPETGEFLLAATGDVRALQVRDRAHRTLRGKPARLGFEPDLDIETQTREMARGDLMLMLSSGILSARDATGRQITSSAIARAARTADGKPETVIGAIRRLLDTRYAYGGGEDRTVLVVHRR